MENIAMQGIEQIQLDTGSPVGSINTYLVFGEKLTLIDTGSNLDKNWVQLKKSLEERQLSIYDIEQVLLTHHHIDHVGLLERILNVHPIPVIGHPNNRPWLSLTKDFIQWHHEFFYEFLEEFGVPKDLCNTGKYFFENMQKLSCHADLTIEINEGDSIPGLSEWEVIETKGHAQSHLSFYRKKDRLMIAGDHIIKHISSNAAIEPPLIRNVERDKPLIQYMRNLKKCSDYSVDMVLTGHGSPVKDLSNLVDDRLNGVEKRTSRIKEILKNKSKNGFEIVHEIFPEKVVREQLMLVVYEIAGHLDVLLERGEIEGILKNGKRYYQRQI